MKTTGSRYWLNLVSVVSSKGTLRYRTFTGKMDKYPATYNHIFLTQSPGRPAVPQLRSHGGLCSLRYNSAGNLFIGQKYAFPHDWVLNTEADTARSLIEDKSVAIWDAKQLFLVRLSTYLITYLLSSVTTANEPRKL